MRNRESEGTGNGIVFGYGQMFSASVPTLTVTTTTAATDSSELEKVIKRNSNGIGECHGFA